MSEYMQNREGEESDNFFCRFSFGQFFALLVLEIFTLFFVFYLGARYGREFLGLEKGAAVAVDASQSAAEASADNEPNVLTTTDPEAAKVARELVERAKTPELKERITKMFDEAKRGSESTVAGGADVASVDASQEEAATTATETAVPPPANVENTQDAAEPKPAADDAAVKKQMELLANAKDSSVIRVKSGDNSRYSLQIGSYQKLDEATESVERWKGKGYSAYIMIADIPERGRWYRVRIGGFASRADAAKYLNEFKANENLEALIVFNEQ